jgi:hypothetical protein
MTSFRIRPKLHGRMDAVYVAEKVVELVWAAWFDDRMSSTYLNQRLGFKAAVSKPLNRNSARRIKLRRG